MGGDWQDLGGSLGDSDNAGVALQPLAHIDQPQTRIWASEWLAAVLASEGTLIDPAAKEQLWSALNSLASAPVPERTLSEKIQALPDTEVAGVPVAHHIWDRSEERRVGKGCVGTGRFRGGPY